MLHVMPSVKIQFLSHPLAGSHFNTIKSLREQISSLIFLLSFHGNKSKACYVNNITCLPMSVLKQYEIDILRCLINIIIKRISILN